MKRLLFAWAAWALMTGLAISADKPNVLIILADDLGYGEIACQGFTKQIPTPNLDSIAAQGTRFTSGYVSGPYCSPTRAGLMTGRYQNRFGHEFNPGPQAPAGFGLPLEEKTIGDRFKAIGYATGWFGKSHLGSEPAFHPLKRGFDEYYGFLGGAHDYFDAVKEDKNPVYDGDKTVSTMKYTTEAFAERAVGFIEKHKAEPWLCYLAFNAVHSPLQAPETYLERFAAVEDPKRRAFCAMLSAMDDAIGSVLAKVRELGQEENTLIVFFCDNGGPTEQITSGNGPLRGFKSQTWEGGIRVPFMMQWKGKIPAAKVESRPVIQLDILPTALAAAGVQAAPEWKLDGVNLLPYLTGENAGVPHETLYWRFGPQVAIRQGDWKLVKGAGMQGIGPRAQGGVSNIDGAELYNLAQDLGESKNVAAANPEVVAQLTAKWNAWNAELVPPKWVPAPQKARKAKQAAQ